MIIDEILMRLPVAAGIPDDDMQQHGMLIGLLGAGGSQFPLFMNDGRQCFTWNGKRMMPCGNFGYELWIGVEATCRTLWGEGWQHAVSEIWGINRRTLQRDRVVSNLLPPRILRQVSRIASLPDAKTMAGALFAYAKLAKGDDAEARWRMIPELFEEISTVPGLMSAI